MIFLWAFGLIVEGKVGTVRFLVIYMLIGTAKSAIAQLLMLFDPGGCALGASAAVFGLLALSMLWAPKNEIKLLLVFWLIPTIFETVEVTVMIFCFYMLAWEVISEVWLIGMTSGSEFMSSAFGHLAGAGVGAGIGYWMIKTRRVDCEGYDLLSVVAGKEGQKVLTLEQEAEQEARKAERAEQIRQERNKANEFIQLYLEHENPEMAVGRFKALKSLDPAAQWDPDQLSRVIKLFIQKQNWNEACQYLGEYAKRVPSREATVFLKQAEIQVLKNSRPVEGLNILRKVDKNKLDDKQFERHGKLMNLAQSRLQEGDLDFAD